VLLAGIAARDAVAFSAFYRRHLAGYGWQIDGATFTEVIVFRAALDGKRAAGS
jgi:hypothetical protein